MCETIRGPRTQSLLQTTLVELDEMTLAGCKCQNTCTEWARSHEKSLAEKLPVH